MAGTHEEVRLSKPANGASQVRAVDSKDLEFLTVDVSNPACDVAGFSVPGIDHGILVGGETSLSGGKLFKTAERKPRLITKFLFANHRRKQIAHDWHGQESPHDSV